MTARQSDVPPDTPLVPERRRFCAVCRRPVGRRLGGSPGRVRGFCSSCRTPFSFLPPLRPGDLLRSEDGRRYQVDECLRHGVQGWVYRGSDRGSDRGSAHPRTEADQPGGSPRPVLLKCLSDDQTASGVDLALLRSLRHRGIVRTVDLVHHEGSPYLVTEFVAGWTLHDLLKHRQSSWPPPAPGAGPRPRPRPGPGLTAPAPTAPAPAPAPAPPASQLSSERSLRWVTGVLDALAYLHGRGFAHGDVAPANVVVGPDDGVTLVDLGTLHSLTHPATAAAYLTPGYDAPELGFTGPTVAADVYATSKLLARLLLGQTEQGQPAEATTFGSATFRRGRPAAARVQRLADHPELGAVLRRGTAADPGDRFPDAQTMAAAIRRLAAEIAAIDGDGTLLGESSRTKRVQPSDGP